MDGLDLEIRGQVADYLASKITLREFKSWFAPRAWHAHKHVDPDTVDLVHEVDLLLAEFGHGDWTEEELKERLIPLVTKYTFALGPAGAAPVASAAAPVTRVQALSQVERAGTTLSVVPA